MNYPHDGIYDLVASLASSCIPGSFMRPGRPPAWGWEIHDKGGVPWRTKAQVAERKQRKQRAISRKKKRGF